MATLSPLAWVGHSLIAPLFARSCEPSQRLQDPGHTVASGEVYDVQQPKDVLRCTSRKSRVVQDLSRGGGVALHDTMGTHM